MNLVVAQVTPKGVRLSADMRVTAPDEPHLPGFMHTGCLKLLCVRPTLCVAYAGKVSAALAAIRRLPADTELEQSAYELANAHRSQRDVDFLLASLQPARLVAIKDGDVTEVEAEWIGDAFAYQAYQYFCEVERPTPGEGIFDTIEEQRDLEIAVNMGFAMDSVVHGASLLSRGGQVEVVLRTGGWFKSVGESVVAVVPRVEDGLFKYREQTHAQSSLPTEPLPAGLGVVPPDWGSGRKGAFTYSMLTPRESGVPAIGLYFYEGALGVLHAPLLLEEPRRVPRTTIEGFAELVRAEHGIDLLGFGLAA